MPIHAAAKTLEALRPIVTMPVPDGSGIVP
jgi:hypothetical protein